MEQFPGDPSTQRVPRRAGEQADLFSPLKAAFSGFYPLSSPNTQKLLAMLLLLLVCVVSFLILVWHSRLVGVSLGLPVAYLFAMLFQHLPGAFAHLVGGHFFADSTDTQIGLQLTTIGTVCFVAAVTLAQRIVWRGSKPDGRWLNHVGTARFRVRCLWGGWLVLVCSSLFSGIASLRAAIDQAGSIWILGVILGFLASVQQSRYGDLFLWLVALSIYPLFVLITGGFLSFGSVSVFLVMSALLIMVKSHIRALTGLVLFSGFCFTAFLSYFENRDVIRASVWGGASLENRLAKCANVITDIKWFDRNSTSQLQALHLRMNQSQFAGMAAQNITSGRVHFLHGRSIWEGLQGLVPRALWPNKPIFAGSSELIREMTDFIVNDTTSYGVGQVMECYINWGVPSLVAGFLLFGFVYGLVDWNAAYALQEGRRGRAILWFLVGTAMLAPLASIAEVMGNIAAALVAGCGSSYVYDRWSGEQRRPNDQDSNDVQMTLR